MANVTDQLRNYNERSNTLLKLKLHQQKTMMIIWLFFIRVIHYRFPESNQNLTAEVYFHQQDEIRIHLSKMRPELFNRRRPMLEQVLPGCCCRCSQTCGTGLCHIQHIQIIYRPLIIIFTSILTIT